MLTNEQNREYNRFKKVQEFLNLNNAVYASFQPFADEAADFTTNLKALEDLFPGKNVVANGITDEKRALKQKIAAATAQVCRKTRAYAIRYNKTELAAQTDTRKDIITRMKDADLQVYVQSIKKIVEGMMGIPEYAPYGVTKAVLDALLADAQLFNKMIGAADVATSGGTVANAAIKKAIDKLRGNIKQFDLLIGEFEQSDPDFVQGYYINSQADNTGRRHSGIEGSVSNQNGEAVSGATVELEGSGKKAVTGLNGLYRIERVRAGDYNVECKAAGYTAKTVVQHITRGRVDELNFVL